MIYLLLAILASTMVAVVMRLSKRYVSNKMTMLAFNYAACAVTAFLFMGKLDLFPAVEGLGFAAGMGVIGGAMYLGGFLLLQWNILENGVVLPAMFQKLGVVVPTAAALIIFKETPTLLQVIGFGAALLAIPMIQGGTDGSKKRNMLGLVLLLIMGGSVDVLSKFYEEWGNPAISDQYLLYVFFCAMVYAALLCVVRKQRVTLWDAVFGVTVGIPNYLCSRFLLLSLSGVPAVVAYPTFSVGTIIAVTAIGVVCFKEKLTRRQMVAMAIILAALALLNM